MRCSTLKSAFQQRLQEKFSGVKKSPDEKLAQLRRLAASAKEIKEAINYFFDLVEEDTAFIDACRPIAEDSPLIGLFRLMTQQMLNEWRKKPAGPVPDASKDSWLTEPTPGPDGELPLRMVIVEYPALRFFHGSLEIDGGWIGTLLYFAEIELVVGALSRLGSSNNIFIRCSISMAPPQDGQAKPASSLH